MENQQLFDKLSSLYYKDIKKYIFEGMDIYARVYKCYDGDSVNIIFKFKDEFIRQPCRINGIDTPEISRCSEEEKQMGLIAKEYISSLLLNQIVRVKILKTDKYGRQLVNIFLLDEDQTNVNKLMIDMGYAKHYDGGTKSSWV